MQAFIILATLAIGGMCGELFEVPAIPCDGVTTLKKVEIEGCSDGPPCKLLKNANTTVRITHTAPRDAKNIKVAVTGLVAETELPFPGLDRWACRQPANKDYCPQEKGKDYVVTINLPILKFFPKIDTTAYVRATDDDAKNAKDELLVCMQVEISVVPNPADDQKEETKQESDEDEE